MNWDAIGTIAELAGALTVIVSLIYVGFQVKQNTAAVRGERFHSINSDVIGFYTQMIVSDHMADLVYRFVDQKASLAEFDGGDLVRVRTLYIIVFRLMDDIFRQVEEGNLPASSLNYFGVNAWLVAPIAREFWSQIRVNYPDDFVDYVESRYSFKGSLEIDRDQA